MHAVPAQSLPPVVASGVAGTMTSSRRARNVGAAIIGNTLEWYDILVYAYFVEAIASNFFPATNSGVSLLLAYGTFGLSFVARPLGAVVLGRIADRAGRRVALVYSSVLMLIGTLAIAILPSYAEIGVAAPVLLLVARLVQGFSVGGEFGSAAAYLAEQSKSHRAFFSSLQFASQGLGMLFAALTGVALTSVLSSESMTEWGWRIPFFIGAALGPIAYFVRRNADETSAFAAAVAQPASTASVKSTSFAVRCLVGAGAVLACNVSIYFLVYVPTFAQTELGSGPAIAYSAAIVSGVTMFLAAPLAGFIADRVGAIRHGLVSSGVILVIAYPLFAGLIAGHDERSILMGQFVMAVATSFYIGALPAILTELFETRSRSLGLAVSYNLAVMTGGGFAQMIFVLLIEQTGSPAAPSYYVVFAAAVSLCSLLLIRRLTQREQPADI